MRVDEAVAVGVGFLSIGVSWITSAVCSGVSRLETKDATGGAISIPADTNDCPTSTITRATPSAITMPTKISVLVIRNVFRLFFESLI